MELTIIERFMALNILPEEGNVIKMRMRLKLIEKLGLTNDEMEKFEVKQLDDGNVKWRNDLPQETEVDLKGPEIAAIGENLKKLSEDDKLKPEQLSLYDKIVGEEE